MAADPLEADRKTAVEELTERLVARRRMCRTSDDAETAAIGEELYRVGGRDAMLSAFAVVKRRLGPTGIYNLEPAWEGIGGWFV